MENIVFIELKRRGYDVFYHADKKECDFVVREGMRIMKAYQVTIAMNDEKTRKREIEGLMEAMNAYGLAEGYILTIPLLATLKKAMTAIQSLKKREQTGFITAGSRMQSRMPCFTRSSTCSLLVLVKGNTL